MTALVTIIACGAGIAALAIQLERVLTKRGF